MEKILLSLILLLALAGLTELIWMIILRISTYKGCRQKLIVILDDSDDPWFALTSAKYRALLSGLTKKGSVIAYDRGMSREKQRTTRRFCVRTGMTYIKEKHTK